MATGIGILSKMGYVALSNWSDSWSAVSTGVPFLSEGLTAEYERIENEILEGHGGKRPSAQGGQTIEGSTEHYLSYNHLQDCIAALMGDDAASVITITDTVDSNYFGLEFEKVAANSRFWPAVPTGMTISGEKNGYIKLTLNWAAKNFESVAAATAISLAAADVPIKFDQLKFRLADQADAIADSDELNIESFEVTFNRNLKTDDYASNSDTTEVKQILEPVENGMRECGLKINFARADSTVLASLAGYKDDDTALQADLLFSGAGANSHLIELPNLRMTEGANAPIGGSEALKMEASFDAYRSFSGNPMYVGNEMKITYAT